MQHMGCVFCGGGPLTREHVIPSWLSGPLGGSGPISHVYLEPPDGAQPSRQWSAAHLDVKVKAVCRRCNQGWMNGLESAMQRVLKPLIQGKGIHWLAPGQCEVLTTWLLKTALM